MKGAATAALAGTALFVLAAASAVADEPKSSTPYIDQLKGEMRQRGEPTQAEPPSATGPDPYLQSIRKRLDESDAQRGGSNAGPEPYIDQLKGELRESSDADGKDQPKSGGPGYTESEKARLGPSQSSGGAIQAVHEGRSELEVNKKVGEIHHAFGLRYGISLTRDVSASAGAGNRNFNEIYGSNYAPDLTLFYEYQPWHSEWVGNVGFFGQAGVASYHGKGAFRFPPSNPGGGSFGNGARTEFRFFTAPVAAGVNYRFNLPRYVRPYVMAGPSVIGYYENRDDGGPSQQGFSPGFVAGGGVAILLDWISRGSSWDLYAEHRVKHYYLTVDYSRLTTVSGDVDVKISGFYAGFAFEL